MKPAPRRPSGMPRKEWNSLSANAKKKVGRLLDFNIHTVQNNSGVQQYGAGQKYDGKRSLMSAPPKQRNVQMGPKGGHIVRECESLGTLEVVDTFQVHSFVIQPGLLFPWGSVVCKQYERYRIRKLSFHYEPTVSAFVSAGQVGRVVMACDYDALEGPPSTIQRIEAMDPHEIGMPYTPFTIQLDPRRLTPEAKFVRHGPVSDSLLNFDAGVIHIAFSGTNVGELGELLVDYEIECFNPRIGEPTVRPCASLYTRHLGVVGAPSLINDAVTAIGGTFYKGYGYTNADSDASLDAGCLEIQQVPDLAEWILPPGNYHIRATLECSGKAITAVQLHMKVTQIDGSTSTVVANVAGTYSDIPGITPTTSTRRLVSVMDTFMVSHAHPDPEKVNHVSFQYYVYSTTADPIGINSYNIQFMFV